MLNKVNHENEQWYVVQDENNHMTYCVYYKNKNLIGYMAFILTPHIDTVLNHTTCSNKFAYAEGSTNYKYIEALILKEM